MVLGLLTAIAACPAIVGTTEAIRQGQRKNAREQHRGVKSNLIVSCDSTSPAGREVDGCAIVLRNNKLYIAVTKTEGRVNCSGHLFAGYFLPYPDQDWGRKGEGLVSTIYDEPPQLNWIYVDQETYEVKYGLRAESEHHLVGPWDCTRIDKRITLEGWEGFMAVEEDEGSWALYFDRDDNGLRGKRSKERILEVELTRKERRKGKDEQG
ncbi:hypothetical protein B0J13DRAFT_532497 [Dactylonectria estremocensis]|uniref:Uncharacterized protein n=2 Tax=Dactylonectria TaxID=1620264 RepID=A0A9P9IG37_9HYPO|nr:hypothetical protein B0J13DRAFT_532497 [Dactylonectria estremocensis]